MTDPAQEMAGAAIFFEDGCTVARVADQIGDDLVFRQNQGATFGSVGGKQNIGALLNGRIGVRGEAMAIGG